MNQNFKTFTDNIVKIGHRHSITSVFDDFIYMAVCALSLGKMEDLYLSIVKNYQPAEVELLASSLSPLIMAYSDGSNNSNWVDLLGQFFEEYGSKSGHQATGQFFTPPAICDLIAQLTSDGQPAPINSYVNDPSCGSGRTLIAHSRLHSQNRFNSFYIASDIDRRCVAMTVLNMVFYGMKGVVIHQDTLSMNTWGGYRIYLPETRLGIRPMSAEECISFLQEQAEPTQADTQKEVIDSAEPIELPKKNTININPMGEQLRLF